VNRLTRSPKTGWPCDYPPSGLHGARVQALHLGRTDMHIQNPYYGRARGRRARARRVFDADEGGSAAVGGDFVSVSLES
jgi:hypothetical protein